jgi:hypothetical protein
MPDQRARHPTRGILGIAYNSTSNGSARIVTEHGILSSKGNNLTVPHGRYLIRSPKTVLHGPLKELQTQIRRKLFKPEMEDQIGIAACCIRIYGGTTGLPRCTCNPTKGCSACCGCVKHNIACSSRCRCNAGCSHTTDLDKIKAREKAMREKDAMQDSAEKYIHNRK